MSDTSIRRIYQPFVDAETKTGELILGPKDSQPPASFVRIDILWRLPNVARDCRWVPMVKMFKIKNGEIDHENRL